MVVLYTTVVVTLARACAGRDAYHVASGRIRALGAGEIMGGDFQDALARVTSSLVTMAKAVREAMRQASAALLAANPTLAQQVTVRAAEIEVLYRVVDDRVFDLIVRRQPVAEELHTALTALQAGADLERMGALAAHVARATLRRHPT